MSPARWRVLFPAALAAGVLGAAAWVVLFSSVLGVREVVVTGNAVLGADEVRRAAAVPDGEPMARVDLDEVRDRVAALRQVESAAVERGWPRTLRIRVVERTPVAAVPLGGRAALVDRYGVVVELRGSAPAGLPVLRVGRPGPGDPATREALRVLTGLPADLAGRLREVSAPGPASVTLLLADGRTVVWGGADRGTAKARILLTLLRQPGERYDVSSPDVAVVR
jgi:cell division protein FtsQ